MFNAGDATDINRHSTTIIMHVSTIEKFLNIFMPRSNYQAQLFGYSIRYIIVDTLVVSSSYKFLRALLQRIHVCIQC